MTRYRLMLVGSILLIIAVFVIAINLAQKKRAQQELLPVYGLDEETLKAKIVSDFSLINQNGEVITQKNVADHIYITNFFFAKCQGICPSMNANLLKVYLRYKGDKEVLFLSHSVKPEEDSVPALNDYAKRYNADPSQWWFLTGDKKQIYGLARNSYLASISEGDGGPDDFVHTQMLTLVDKERRLRGFYDGLDSLQVNQLISDVQRLLNEYH
jgi:protein SCO1